MLRVLLQHPGTGVEAPLGWWGDGECAGKPRGACAASILRWRTTCGWRWVMGCLTTGPPSQKFWKAVIYGIPLTSHGIQILLIFTQPQSLILPKICSHSYSKQNKSCKERKSWEGIWQTGSEDFLRTVTIHIISLYLSVFQIFCKEHMWIL